MKEKPSDRTNKTPDVSSQELQTVFDIWSSVKGLSKPREAAPPPQYSYSYEGESDSEQGAYSRLHDYLRSARKHVWLILGIVTVVTTLVAVYMARQPDVYEAQAHILA